MTNKLNMSAIRKFIFITIINMCISFGIVPFIFIYIPFIISNLVIQKIIIASVMLLILFVYKKINKKFNRIIVKGNVKDYLFVLPLIIIFVSYNLYNAYVNNLVLTKNIFDSVIITLSVAISEEIIFRSINIVSYFEDIKEEGSCLINLNLNLKVMMITSSLLFSIMHLFNIVNGADVLTTLFQTIIAFSFGMITSAIFIRTGNIVPNIIAHFLFNISGYIFTVVYENGGILTNKLVVGIPEIALLFGCILLIFFSFYLIKDDFKPNIIETWANKFNY